ncbi:hypothetical protein BJX63DRAFT_430482 [Aspergillus granulosus]|uniref:Uncharacterized protein n=1 Tax=Aspergillus granulosus TaxID=176169 RepID=A0ABR4HK73_9EURO
MSDDFGNIFSHNSINSALMRLEVPRLVSRLWKTLLAMTRFLPAAAREGIQSRTGRTLTWNVRRRAAEVQEGRNQIEGGAQVADVHGIIAQGSLEKRVKNATEA